jgi:Glycosyltransferase Family 4
LSAAGARALVACTARLKGELQAKGGIFLPLPSSSKNPLLMALSVRRLARVIEMERADIIHVRSRALGWMAYGATRLTKTPLVTSYGCGNDSRSPISARYNSVLARGDIVLAESNFAAAMAAKHFPLAAEKIRVIRRGIDCQVFAQDAVAPEQAEAVRRQWQAAPHEQVVLMLAPSCDSSGAGELIEAVRLLSRSGLSGLKFVLACGKNGAVSRGLGLDRGIARARLARHYASHGPLRDA